MALSDKAIKKADKKKRRRERRVKRKADKAALRAEVKALTDAVERAEAKVAEKVKKKVAEALREERELTAQLHQENLEFYSELVVWRARAAAEGEKSDSDMASDTSESD